MVTHQLQVESRTAKERWPETDVLPLSHAGQPVVYTYNVDELNHCQSKLDGDYLTEILDRPNERIVSMVVKQRLHKSHFIVTSQTCIQPPAAEASGLSGLSIQTSELLLSFILRMQLSAQSLTSSRHLHQSRVKWSFHLPAWSASTNQVH